MVVTLNYRLGFEGFGHVPAVDGEEACPDNRGLLDQIAALRWVRDNIASFGGDPGRITVAGQSSGATSVACLMAMDRARGLFLRAVAHSAVNACATPESAARTTAEVATAAGVPATYAGLASASPHALVEASDRVAEGYRRDPGSGHRHYDPAIYGPVAGVAGLAADPLTACATGASREVDLMVCHTVEEYWLLDAVGSCAKITTERQLAAFASDHRLPPSLLDGYRALMPGAPVSEIYLAVYGDLMFGEYSSRLAESHARAGGRAHLARFVRRRDGQGSRSGPGTAPTSPSRSAPWRTRTSTSSSGDLRAPPTVNSPGGWRRPGRPSPPPAIPAGNVSDPAPTPPYGSGTPSRRASQGPSRRAATAGGTTSGGRGGPQGSRCSPPDPERRPKPRCFSGRAPAGCQDEAAGGRRRGAGP